MVKSMGNEKNTVITECPFMWIADAIFQSKTQSGSFVSNGFGFCVEERCAIWNKTEKQCGLIARTDK